MTLGIDLLRGHARSPWKRRAFVASLFAVPLEPFAAGLEEACLRSGLPYLRTSLAILSEALRRVYPTRYLAAVLSEETPFLDDLRDVGGEGISAPTWRAPW